LNVDFAKVDMVVVVVVESKTTLCWLRGKSGPVIHPITTLEIVPTYVLPLNHHWSFNASTVDFPFEQLHTRCCNRNFSFPVKRGSGN